MASTPTALVSPTSPNIAPKGAPNEWTIEEVIQYITSTDPGLAVHADLFRTHVSNNELFEFAYNIYEPAPYCLK